MSRGSVLRIAAPALAGIFLLLASPARALFANRDYYWTGNPVAIPVCWENPAAAPAMRREWARDAVESSWERYARVNFVEWDTCNPGDPGVHIRIDTFSAMPGGSTLDGVTNGAHLDLTYSGYAGCFETAAALEHCIRAVAAHEFGHVLGFYHEEERYDYFPAPGLPPACAKQTSFQNSTPQYYGAYDLESVMSYCGQPATSPATWTEELSPGDIAAVQRAYGRRIPGSLTSPGGHCVAAHADGPDFESVFLWSCDEFADDQEWWLSDLQGRFTLSLDRPFPLASRCMESRIPPGNPQAYIHDCSTLATQRWKLENAAIRGWGGLCLDLQNGNTANFTPVQLWQCGAAGGVNQRWAITATGEIRFGGPTGKCLTVPASGTAYLHDCEVASLQSFDPTPSGELRLRHQPGKCLDSVGWTDVQYLSGQGLPGNGQRLQAFQCLGVQLNQKWNVSGAIRHTASDRCLARLSDAETNGTLIQIETCSGSSAQEFDYYFLPALDLDDDADGIADDADDCPFFASPSQVDTDADRRGNPCECTDQNGDGTNTVSDLLAINAAIFNPALVTPLCDGNGDGLCNVGDIVAANAEIFSPANTSTCARQPVPGP